MRRSTPYVPLCSARVAGHSGHNLLSGAFPTRPWTRLQSATNPVIWGDVP
jgi:hypothetical protein